MLVLTTALISPAMALAQSTAATAGDSGGAQDIVVTAQRRAERLENVPISVTALSSETLRASGVSDTQSLERVTPGLSMQSQNGYVNPSIRGVSTTVVTAGAENPIAIYLDGVYIGNQGAGIFSLPDVDHIEVLKGPQGTLFGRNATGGAIQIATKKPSMTPTGEISLTTGIYPGAGGSRSAYDFVVRGFVSGPIATDTAAASIAFNVRRSSGYNDNVVYGAVSPEVDRALGSSRTGALRDYYLRGKLLLTPTDTLSLLFTGYYSSTRNERTQGGYIAYGGTALSNAELAFPGRVTPSRPWQDGFDAHPNYNKVNTRGASLKADLDLPIGVLTSTTAYSYSRYAEFLDSDKSYIPGCLAAFACTAPFDATTQRDFQQELLFASEKFGNFSFVAGANYYHSNATLNVLVNDFTQGSHPLGNATNPPLFFYDQRVKTDAFGIFAEGTYQATDRLTLIAGLRYSSEKKTGILYDIGSLGTTFATNVPLNDTKAKRATPRASVRYEIADRTNIYATFSQGFKSGVIPGGAIGVPEVKPEKITAYEIGFKTAQSDYSLNVAAFYYDYTDLQVQTNGGAGGTVNIVDNAAKARIYGLDVDGTIRVTPQLSIRGGVSWIPYAKYRSYPNAPVNLPRPIDPSDPTNVNSVAGPGVFVPGGTLDLGGTRLFKTPKITTTASLTYTADVGAGALSITPNIYYASKLYTEPTHLGALSTDNFKLGADISYTPNNAGWRVSVWGKNLTNNSAFVSLATTASGLNIIPSEPLELGATFSFSF